MFEFFSSTPSIIPSFFNMAESGIDIGYDLSSLLSEDFDIENAIDFEDLLGTPKNQDFYELTSKTLPMTERWGKK